MSKKSKAKSMNHETYISMHVDLNINIFVTENFN
jgi:hypothetical protein